MNHTRIAEPRFPMRIAMVIALIAAAALLAGTAYTHDAAKTQTVRYACPDGERFTVEHLAGHIRLRTGSGVFALAERGGGVGTIFSDGSTTFSLRDDQAALERPGIAIHADCKPAALDL